MSEETPLGPFGIVDIMELLPHRYPFLLVDRVLEVVPEKRLVAVKNVTINEPFFPGHFPVRPIMPGVLITEAMAQAAALLAFYSQKEPKKAAGRPVLLMGLDNVRFRRPVEPGDVLTLTVELVSNRHRIWKLKAKAEVAGKLAAEAELMATLG